MSLAAENPDYGIKSLFDTIKSGEFPSWTLYVVSTQTSPVVAEPQTNFI